MHNIDWLYVLTLLYGCLWVDFYSQRRERRCLWCCLLCIQRWKLGHRGAERWVPTARPRSAVSSSNGRQWCLWDPCSPPCHLLALGLVETCRYSQNAGLGSENITKASYEWMPQALGLFERSVVWAQFHQRVGLICLFPECVNSQ